MNLNPFQKWAILLAELVALIFLLLPESLFHSFSCELQNLPQSYRSSNGYFIDNQVIVVGPRDEVEAVIGPSTPGTPTTPLVPTITPTDTPGPVLTTATIPAFETPEPTGTPTTPIATATPPVEPESERVMLNLIEGCDLSYLNTRKVSGSDSVVETRQLVMRLYEIPQGSTVGDVITQIGDRAEGREIFADPNYLTRLADLPNDPCALPDDPGGNGGKPFGGPGAFTIDPKAYDVVQAQQAFREQWAFKEINSLPASLTGSGVRVGVFDTSPYRISFPFIKRVTEALPSPLWFTNWDAGGTTMASSHGLFVAELIHAMAPNSRVQLIRVLYEDGCGELWTLNKGLEDYKSRMSAWTQRLDKTVINMSMGIRAPEPKKPGDTASEATDEVTETLTALFNEELETLKSLIQKADKMGAIIIASAGNDSTKFREVSSGRTVDERAKMQIPANFDEVIGVAATNPDGAPSCYTNIGDVGAPGGDGGEDTEEPKNPTDPKDLCAPRAFSWNQNPGPCTDIANCKYGLISLARTRYGPRYMLWSGTSFAAPLVSGMAALGYQRMEKDRVVCLIQNGPSAGTDPVLGTGLINLNNLTDTTFVPLCP